MSLPDPRPDAILSTLIRAQARIAELEHDLARERAARRVVDQALAGALRERDAAYGRGRDDEAAGVPTETR